MTRRRLATIVGVLGFFAAGGSLVLMLVMGSVFADARTENIAGPGVDVFVRTPFPLEGSKVVLDIEARGGKRAGVRSITAWHGDRQLAEKIGRGAHWSGSIGGRGRGSDEETLRIAIPPELKAGATLSLALRVAYVCAMSEDGGYRNKHFSDVVKLDIAIHSPSSRLRAQLARVALGLGCFAMWFFLVWGVAKLYAKTSDEMIDTASAEWEGIGLLMGFLGGSILGYWLFAWRIANALEVSTLAVVLLMIAWCVLPLAWTWLWWKRRQNRSQLPSARVVAR